MVTRGAAPSAACPRCGEVAPSSPARLVTCASCKLAFDPSAERPVSIRRNRAQVAIDRLSITRTPTSFTLRAGREPRAVLVALGGLGLVAVAIVYGLSVLGIIEGVVGALVTYLGLAFLGRHRIHVDPHGIRAGRALLRKKTIAFLDIAKIEVGYVRSGEEAATYYVAAQPPIGAPVVLFVSKNEDLVHHVARVVRDALATMPTS